MVLVSTGTRTADGDSTASPKNVPSTYDSGIFMIDVSAVGGTSPVLNIYIVSKDGYSGNWFTIAEYLNISAIGQYPIIITKGLGTTLACVWKISGTTPSFTFSVTAILKR